ncbi:MAG: hypothetical protein EOP06_18055, partial [Proteobacteria bacterium]
MLSLYIASRVVFAGLGVRFDAAALYQDYLQFLDLESLKFNLLRSLWVWHSQPPLFNALIGMALKQGVFNGEAVLHGMFIMCGLVLMVSLFRLQLALGVTTALAAVSSLIFMISPATLLHENWLFYTYPVTALLALSACLLWRFLQKPSALNAHFYFSSLALLILAQGIFTIFWFILVLGYHLISLKKLRKRIMVASVGPGLAVVVLLGRTLYFTGSVAAGEAFASFQMAANTTYSLLSTGETEDLIGTGQLSPIARVAPYLSFYKYKEVFKSSGRKWNEPLLDNEHHAATGFRNFNSVGYLELSRAMKKDAFVVLKMYPERYGQRVFRQFRKQYFLPAEDHPPFESNYVNSEKLANWKKIFSRIFLGQWKDKAPAVVLL